MLDAVAGVQSQSETVWRQADTYNVPRICFVNKMDRVGASYERTIDSIRRRLNGNPVAVQLPIGEEAEFRGVIDLIGGRATMFSMGGSDGDVARDGPVPEDLQEIYHNYRQSMIEKIVETDDDLLARYLDGDEIEEESLRAALRQATMQRQLIPVLCGSAIANKGVHNLLDAIVAYLPSPADVPPVEAIRLDNEETVLRAPNEDGPLSALAFKVAVDPFVGRLVFLRIYSGKVKAGASVTNATKGRRESWAACYRCTPTTGKSLRRSGPATSAPLSVLGYVHWGYHYYRRTNRPFWNHPSSPHQWFQWPSSP